MKTIGLVVVLSTAAAAWVGLGAWMLSDLATVKPAMDTIAKREKATPIYVVPLAQADTSAFASDSSGIGR